MKKTICLNMIVKDESLVIKRCLSSVKEIIDYWVIVDTGSSDGTQQIIQKFLADSPGELHERPWVDFATNRNEALSLAKNKCDYLLFLDADQILIMEDRSQLLCDQEDVYYCLFSSQLDRYYHELLVASHLNWKWVGTIHEGLVSSEAKTSKILQNVSIVATQEGSRSRKGNKYQSDIDALKKELEKDPSNGRNVFYLAVSQAFIGQYEEALINYEKRAGMGGNPEEVFVALLSIGVMQEILQKDPKIFLQSFERAFHFRQTRAEPLYCMAQYYLNTKNYLLSYLISKFALTIPYPEDIHYVRFSVYDYELLMQFAESSYGLGYVDETCWAYRKLIDKFEEYLKGKQISDSLKEQIAEVLPGMRRFMIQAEMMTQ